MGCCCCCSNCCCDPFKYAHISAILCGIEAGLFVCVNTVLVLIHTCVIEPPEDLPGFLQKPWAWFFYDESQCMDQYGQQYLPPSYIYDYPIPHYFRDSIEDAVSPQANYIYQLSYTAVHLTWIMFAFLLFYGNARKLSSYYVPWMVTVCLLLCMDIIFASFYIVLWSDTNPGWEDSEAFFWMIFLYFRAFFFFAFNFVQLLNVFHAFRLAYRKRSKQRSREDAIRQEMSASVLNHIQEAQHQPTTQVDLYYPYHQRQLTEQPKSTESSMEIPRPILETQTGSIAPSRSRPFSYFTMFRPQSAADVDAMKKRGIQNYNFNNEEHAYCPQVDYDIGDDKKNANPTAPTSDYESGLQRYYATQDGLEKDRKYKRFD